MLEEDREHPAWRLEDKQYHPYVTYNTVADGIDKQYDGLYNSICTSIVSFAILSDLAK